MEVPLGTAGADSLTGSDDTDVIRGLAGSDTLDGLGGRDAVLGGDGDDAASGGFGDDLVFGGNGADTIWGDTQDDPQPPPFSSFRPGNNVIFAGDGNDSVIAGFGSDTVFGGAGDDLISGPGASRGPTPSAAAAFLAADQGDLLLAGAGNDSVEGWGGRDTILAGSGSDTILGAHDADLLAGGPGGDVFIFRFLGREGIGPDTGVGEGQRDVVLDFHPGEDRIDLSGYLNPFAPSTTPAEALFLGEGEFRGGAAAQQLQVRYEVMESEGRTILQLFAPIGFLTDDPDLVPGLPPPAGPTEEIELRGIVALTDRDAIL